MSKLLHIENQVNKIIKSLINDEWTLVIEEDTHIKRKSIIITGSRIKLKDQGIELVIRKDELPQVVAKSLEYYELRKIIDIACKETNSLDCYDLFKKSIKCQDFRLKSKDELGFSVSPCSINFCYINSSGCYYMVGSRKYNSLLKDVYKEAQNEEVFKKLNFISLGLDS